MSDLERAQEWLGCERYQEKPMASNCWTHVPGQPKIADLTWPCTEATRLASLLAETRADELDDVAAAFESSANRVVKAKGETERTRYAHEVVDVLRNRAQEVRT